MNKQRLTLISTIAAALLLMACDRKTVFDQYVHTPLNGWEKNDTIAFAIDSIGQSGEYTEEIGVRTNGKYPFTSLTLAVHQTIQPSGEVRDTTINCTFTDKNDQVVGNGIGYSQFSFPLETVRMEVGDTLKVIIRHNMKREILPGVLDIGFKLTRK